MPAPRAVYRRDDRKDICDLKAGAFREEVEKRSRSVAALVWLGHMMKVKSNRFKLSTKAFRCYGDGRYPVSDTIRFRNQHYATGLVATAFLVSPTIVATAGHAVRDEKAKSSNLEHLRLVFGFQRQDKVTQEREISVILERDIYQVGEIIDYRFGEQDWALLRLDREVLGRDALDVELEDKISVGQNVFMLGHPNGLPLKIADRGRVTEKNEANPAYFRASLDSFDRNSGSPVFSRKKPYKVVGLLAGDIRGLFPKSGKRGKIIDLQHAGHNHPGAWVTPSTLFGKKL